MSSILLHVLMKFLPLKIVPILYLRPIIKVSEQPSYFTHYILSSHIYYV